MRLLVSDLAAHVESFRRRVVVDAVLEATSAYWIARSATIEAARPQPGDYPGTSSPEDQAARDARLAAAALACRRRAQLALFQTCQDWPAAIDDALAAAVDDGEQVAS